MCAPPCDIIRKLTHRLDPPWPPFYNIAPNRQTALHEDPSILASVFVF